MHNFETKSELNSLNKYDKVCAFKTLLIGIATGGKSDDDEYKFLRTEIINIDGTNSLLPRWVTTNRASGQFWGFIQPMFGTYKERSGFIYKELTPVLDFLQDIEKANASNLSVFDYNPKSKVINQYEQLIKEILE